MPAPVAYRDKPAVTEKPMTTFGGAAARPRSARCTCEAPDPYDDHGARWCRRCERLAKAS